MRISSLGGTRSGWRTFSSFRGGLTANEAAAQNYYDRALINYAWWVRTAAPEYWRRATYYLIGYRDAYLRPSDFHVQPHDIQIDGLALHYLLTGDPESRRAVARFGEYYAAVWAPQVGDPQGRYLESRIQARTLAGLLTANALGLDQYDFATLARGALTAILGTQNRDGSYRYRNLCDQQYNFMVGILNNVLIRYYDEFEADGRIVDAVRKSLDFMWTTQWVGKAGGFRYATGPCPGKAGTAPSPDLNLQIVNGFGWYAWRSGRVAYRMYGDLIFDTGVRQAWLRGVKQFSENYAGSYRYLFYRRNAAH